MVKTYLVQTTSHALKDMNDLYEYIAVNLQAPENAIGTLSYMPERIKLVDAEPRSASNACRSLFCIRYRSTAAWRTT